VWRIITGILSALAAVVALCLLVIALDGIEVPPWALWTAAAVIPTDLALEGSWPAAW
jgi:hypothetical protein